MPPYKEIANSHPKLQLGKVYCLVCRRVSTVNVEYCFEHGWPECCGETMTIDSPGKCTCYGRALSCPVHAQREV